MIRTTDEPVRPGRTARTVARLPPTSFFLISSLFHYLGPSLAVLLFARVDVLGVAWLRIASAAVVFALWRRPWRILAGASGAQRSVFVGLGVVLAAMNSLFYLAVDRLPLATVGAIEFLGIVVLAAGGARTKRNVLALVIAVAGVAVLTDVRLSGQTLGFVFAFANCAGFMLYVVLGHRIASIPASGDVPADAAGRAASMSGIDQLGLSMLVAAVVATPFTVGAAGAAFLHPVWLASGSGCARRSSRTSPTSSPWPGCLGRRSRSCSRCYRPRLPRSGSSCSVRCRRGRTSPAWAWSSPASPSITTRPQGQTRELLDRVVELGGRVLSPPNDMPWGQRVGHIEDPDGNAVNLTHEIARD
ncbi:MAG: EamA family transporter [Jatrophihabitans sp.]|nr:EamA family transporter [Jatrophihabitans sp.]